MLFVLLMMTDRLIDLGPGEHFMEIVIIITDTTTKQ